MKEALTLYFIDEIHGRVTGLSDEDCHYIVKEMSHMIPGAYMMASVMSGNHDGKESTFSYDGEFYLYEIDTVFRLLDRLGYDTDNIEVEDLRLDLEHPVSKENLPEINADFFEGVTMWDHQTDFFRAAVQVDKGIYDASTSAGKTLVSAGISKLYDPYYPSLFLTVNAKLAKDAAKMYEKLGLDYVLISAKTPPAKRQKLIETHRHIITTRKLAMGMKNCLVDFRGALVIDEIHVLGDAFFDFARECLAECPIRFGLTGTLPSKRKNSLKLQKIYNIVGGGVIKEVLPGYLMDQGHAAKLDIRVVKINDRPGKEKMVEAGEEWCWEMESAHYANDDRVAEIAQFIDKNCPRNTLVICDPELGNKLSQELNCDFIDGTVDDVEDREVFYSEFDKRDDYRLVTSFGTGGIGLSIDMIHYGVVIDIGSNPSRAGQAVGRFMRKDNDGDKKDSAVVWDIYSNTKYGQRQKAERMAYYRERGFTYTDKQYTIEI